MFNMNRYDEHIKEFLEISGVNPDSRKIIFNSFIIRTIKRRHGVYFYVGDISYRNLGGQFTSHSAVPNYIVPFSLFRELGITRDFRDVSKVNEFLNSNLGKEWFSRYMESVNGNIEVEISVNDEYMIKGFDLEEIEKQTINFRSMQAHNVNGIEIDKIDIFKAVKIKEVNKIDVLEISVMINRDSDPYDIYIPLKCLNVICSDLIIKGAEEVNVNVYKKFLMSSHSKKWLKELVKLKLLSC